MIQVHKKQPDRITTMKFNDNNTSQWTTFLDGKTSCLKIRLVKIKTKNNICFVWVFGSTIKWRITAEWGRVNMICYFIPNRQAWKSDKCEMKKKCWLEIAFFSECEPFRPVKCYFGCGFIILLQLDLFPEPANETIVYLGLFLCIRNG